MHAFAELFGRRGVGDAAQNETRRDVWAGRSAKRFMRYAYHGKAPFIPVPERLKAGGL